MNIQKIAIDPVRDRATWLALRQQDITASDVPAVCGEGMYGSATRVWAEKLGRVGPQEATKAMTRGLIGEASVFSAIEMYHPDWEVRRAKVYFRDADAGIGATPDGAALIPGVDGITIVQAKLITRSSFTKHWLHDPDNFDGGFKAPLAYQLQTLTEAMLAEAPHAIIAALVHGNEWDEWVLRTVPVHRNAAAEQRIRDMVATFRARYLETGIQPPVDMERDEEIIKQLWPKDNGREIDLSGDNELPEIVAQLENARCGVKLAKETERWAKTLIADKMQDYTFARLADGRRISFKLMERAGHVVGPSVSRIMRILK